MEIRSIRPDDFSAWLPLWEKYNSFYNRVIPAEVTEKTWNRFLSPNESVYALVAEVEGCVVGFVAYLFHRHTALINETCYLQDLYIDEKYRGQGIGKALILLVSERAKENGCLQVYWMTHESNEVARKLYNKITKPSGFIVYSMRT